MFHRLDILRVGKPDGSLLAERSVMHAVIELSDEIGDPRVEEASFKALVEAVEDYAIFRLDPLGHVVSWNTGAEWINGYQASEILGQHFSCFYSHEDVVRGIPSFHLRLAAERGRYVVEGWRLRNDESRFWAHVSITALKNEQGKLLGFVKLTHDATRRKQAEDALRQSERLLDGFFSASPAGLAIVDRELRYQHVNETMATIDGAPASAHVGRTVREVIPALADQVEPCMRRVLLTGQKVVDREICGPMPAEGNALGYWVANYFPIIGDTDEISGIGCVQLDITDCRRAEDSLRRLSGRLMELQDQERRRIARELHDSIGQCLTAIKINLELLDREFSATTHAPRSANALAEALKLSEQCSSDVRTISYLLHPPLLDERGLSSAIRWYADGFAQRSGIELSMDLPDEDTRFSQPLEMTLFRIVQESLTNIHRHSGSSTAHICLLADAENAILEVQDEGRGMPFSSFKRCNSGSLGVGIAGMRERVRQLGGQLEIQSRPGSTTVRAILPIGGDV